MPTPNPRDLLRLALLAVAIGWLLIDAPLSTTRELQFVLTVLLATIVTRTVSWRTAAYALSLGMALAVPATILAGHLLGAAGFSVSEGAGSWGVVPVLEEALKLVPVLLIAILHRRRSGDSLNPSDWLLAGCAAGAGFAMIENAALTGSSPAVLRDMALQYGPHIGGLFVVPGAWGAAGFVGHAAATGIAAGSIGVALALRRQRTTAGSTPLARLKRIPGPWWTVAAAACAWVILEHALANLYVNTGAGTALLLGNGRLTPWLFVLLVVAVVAVDAAHARQTLARSAILRTRRRLVALAWRGDGVPVRRSRPQIARLYLRELRTLNTAAWATFDRSAA